MNLDQFKEAISKYNPFMHCVMETYFSFTPNVTDTCDIAFNSERKLIYFPKYNTIKIRKEKEIKKCLITYFTSIRETLASCMEFLKE